MRRKLVWPDLPPPPSRLIDLADFHNRITRLRAESLALIDQSAAVLRQARVVLLKCRRDAGMTDAPPNHRA